MKNMLANNTRRLLLLTSLATAIILAAGESTRFADSSPKIYAKIGGKTLLEQTVTTFCRASRVNRILVVINHSHLALFAKVANSLPEVVSKITGGDSRQLSVFRALKHLEASPPQLVLVHDCARPFVNLSLIERVADKLDTAAAVIPVIPVVDALKRLDAKDSCVVESVDRQNLYMAQTPQGFRYKALLDAHNSAIRNNLTGADDAELLTQAGIRVTTVKGNFTNRKITFSGDLPTLGRTSDHAQ